jgi:hypothetical protein
MRIVKHAREAHAVLPAPAGTSNSTASFSPAVGQLLGIDVDGVLEVSNSFALPPGALGGATPGQDGEGESRGQKTGTSPQFSLIGSFSPNPISSHSKQIHGIPSPPSRRSERRCIPRGLLRVHKQRPTISYGWLCRRTPRRPVVGHWSRFRFHQSYTCRSRPSYGCVGYVDR